MSDAGDLSDVAVVGLSKAGELLDCGEWYVRKLIKEGKLKSFLDGKTRKVTVRSIKDRLEHLLEAQTAPPTTPPVPRRNSDDARK